MRILVLNGGSSSLKFALFEDTRRLEAGVVERVTDDHAGALEGVIARLAPFGGLASLDAVGHRLVHGGVDFVEPTILDRSVVDRLRALQAIDPDHLPAEIAIIESVTTAAPSLTQVACFDTAFHAQMLPVAQLLPIPRRFLEAGVRRFGFHGLSYDYLLGEVRRLEGDAFAESRLIFAHLGSGSSVVAIKGGRSIDTTMGFTPNSGVPMGTRSGDLDPGLVLHLARNESLDLGALDELLSKKSGLLGVSGTSADMRDLLSREPDDSSAAEAIDLYCHSVRKAIGALATTIDGIDGLVFAGGIGERAAEVRARIARGLGHLGIEIDDDRNDRNEAVISRDGSRCRIRVIATDEEVVIARDTARLLRSGA